MILTNVSFCFYLYIFLWILSSLFKWNACNFCYTRTSRKIIKLRFLSASESHGLYLHIRTESFILINIQHSKCLSTYSDYLVRTRGCKMHSILSTLIRKISVLIFRITFAILSNVDYCYYIFFCLTIDEELYNIITCYLNSFFTISEMLMIFN